MMENYTAPFIFKRHFSSLFCLYDKWLLILNTTDMLSFAKFACGVILHVCCLPWILKKKNLILIHFF